MPSTAAALGFREDGRNKKAETTSSAKLEGLRRLPESVGLIPLGAGGEPRPDLLVKKPRTVANCEDYRKSKWEMRYHQ